MCAVEFLTESDPPPLLCVLNISTLTTIIIITHCDVLYFNLNSLQELLLPPLKHFNCPLSQKNYVFFLLLSRNQTVDSASLVLFRFLFL